MANTFNVSSGVHSKILCRVAFRFFFFIVLPIKYFRDVIKIIALGTESHPNYSSLKRLPDVNLERFQGCSC